MITRGFVLINLRLRNKNIILIQYTTLGTWSRVDVTVLPRRRTGTDSGRSYRSPPGETVRVTELRLKENPERDDGRTERPNDNHSLRGVYDSTTSL